ncbi:MAG: hypothetical protein IPP90_13865 [Gemmatimonadaceae bacterium]|nr:hypothetical protein [Gemmatimonadaceae bacterium]
MRSVMGLLWALAGAVIGFMAGALLAVAIGKLTNMSNREGAAGYFMIAIGLLGAVAGLVAGMALYGRSAPAGQATAYAVSSAFGVVALVAVVVLGMWAFMNLRETPAMYGNAMANLEMELRLRAEDVPAGDSSTHWLSVEVQTTKTRPEGTVIWSDMRTEGGFRVIPVVQGPLYRSGSRVIVVRVQGLQDEIFIPPMRRMPDPKADWSEWYRPKAVEPPYGVVPPSPLRSILELRYRVRKYGE